MRLLFCLTALVLSSFTLAERWRAIILSANVTFSQNGSFCSVSGSPIEFLCNASNVSAISWKLNNEQIRILSSSNQVTELMATKDGIRIQVVSVIHTENDRVDMISRLVVDPSSLQFGDNVTCSSSINDIASLVYNKMAPPPLVSFTSNITKETGNTVELTLQWNNSFTETHTVDEYCVIAYGGACQSEITCLPPGTEYVCNGLEAGRMYEFNVFAKNCGNQSQTGANASFNVIPEFPEQPAVCVSVPVYDQLTKQLVGIQSTWNASRNPTEITPGVRQDVLSYNVTFERDGISRESKNVLATDICKAGVCEYDLSTSFLGSYYTLSVAAGNIVGVGEYLTCSPQEISTTSMVQVTVSTRSHDQAIIDCHPLHILNLCKVCYGTERPDCGNLTCLEPAHPDAEGHATVVLPRLERQIKYCYTAAVVVENREVLVVQGSFSTACDVFDLYQTGSNTEGVNIDENVDKRCPSNSVGSLSIPNGIVCYTGTTLGSTAIYFCDYGFEITTDSNPRVCQEDGNWNGTILACLQSGNTRNHDDKNTTAIIAAVITVILLIAAGATGGLVASLVYIYKLKQQPKTEQGKLHVVNPLPRTQSVLSCPLPPIPKEAETSADCTIATEYEELPDPEYFKLNQNNAYQEVLKKKHLV